MSKQTLLLYSRLFFGFLGISAVMTEIIALVGRGIFSPVTFFSYFTIESNILAALFLIFYGLYTNRSSKKINQRIETTRGAIVLYMLMTGVIFAVLLAGIENATLTAVPWDNVVLHYIMPIAVLIDWIVDTPKINLTFKKAWPWLIFPLAYVAYSLVRGAIDGWYPYPFLDPSQGGYTTVVTTTIILALGVIVVSWILCATTRTKTRK